MLGRNKKEHVSAFRRRSNIRGACGLRELKIPSASMVSSTAYFQDGNANFTREGHKKQYQAITSESSEPLMSNSCPRWVLKWAATRQRPISMRILSIDKDV